MCEKRLSYLIILLLILIFTVSCDVLDELGDMDDQTVNLDQEADIEVEEPGEEQAPGPTTSWQPVSGTYYVSPGGDDSDGSTPAAAFRMISKAISAASPGNTIVVMPGVYSEEMMEMYDLGDPGSPITIRGEGDGVILDGAGKLKMGFWCEGCKGFVIENLEVRNYTDIGIGFSESDNITMRNLVVHNNGFAVQLKDWELEGYGIHIEISTNVTVENCEVYENGPNPQPIENMMGTGINIYGCTDYVVRNNRSYDNIGGGALLEDSVNALFEGNELWGNDLDATADGWWDGALWVDGGHDIIVRNNIFRDNLGPGIQISDEDSQYPYGYVIENNTITGNYYGLFIWGLESDDYPPENILKLVDNDISSNTRKDVIISAGWCMPGIDC